MNLQRLRTMLQQEEIDLDLSLPHAIVEARKDGLTVKDLESAVIAGEIVEDYGDRALLLHTVPGYKIPFHIVLEYLPDEGVATVVTAYIPDRQRWESDWKTRKTKKRKSK